MSLQIYIRIFYLCMKIWRGNPPFYSPLVVTAREIAYISAKTGLKNNRDMNDEPPH